jgi:hypothetical protein
MAQHPVVVERQDDRNPLVPEKRNEIGREARQVMDVHDIRPNLGDDRGCNSKNRWIAVGASKDAGSECVVDGWS